MNKINIGVLVVAYNAESTIESTLDRIPQDFISKVYSVLISDDKSRDLTSVKANLYSKSSALPIKVVVQPKNLGYGGNQKFGYSWAISNGWDLVVLLHADGQYAPELMPLMVQPLIHENADAVFGSRMINKSDALKGGMPKYKWIGNQVLTFLQNKLTGQNLSEWHSGYRAYRVSSLKEIEIPIPTYYGDEISHVNGLEYAREIIWDTIRYRLKNGVSRESNISN
jgi:glycosyltransferase involved in cell wall biosynthesis